LTRHADIVGLLPAPIRSPDDSDDPADRLPAAFEKRIATLRSVAGDRFNELELSAFVTIRITDHRRSATEDLIAQRGWSGLEPETVWQMPTILIGSADQIRADLHARRERFGLPTSSARTPTGPR
jgi:hypothetical protein